MGDKLISYNVSTVHTNDPRNSESNNSTTFLDREYAKGSLHYRGSVLWISFALEIRHHWLDYNEFM